ncbi:MAG: hypothetical protein KJO07_00430, partial [Deltaproteobacteria bacterium]|nr:hypothetical protein [Deltaproteobacteria bacterium]
DLVLVAPLTMASELPPTREGRRPALLVGSERIRTLWTEIARRTGMVFDGESLSKTVGAVRVEVREDTVLGDVPHLLASLSWERSLGPEVGVAKNVRGKRRRRRHGRFPQQSEHLFSQLVALIAELESYDVGERSASLSIPIRGVRRGPLLRFCRIALDVASKLQELQRSMPLPEPLALSERVWRQLASRLDGTLWPGPAMVTGTLSGANVELGVDWEERDEATWIAVRPPWAVDQGPSLADLASELGLDAVRFEDDALRTSLPAWPTAADEPIAVARKLVDLAQRIRLGGPFR